MLKLLATVIICRDSLLVQKVKKVGVHYTCDEHSSENNPSEYMIRNCRQWSLKVNLRLFYNVNEPKCYTGAKTWQCIILQSVTQSDRKSVNKGDTYHKIHVTRCVRNGSPKVIPLAKHTSKSISEKHHRWFHFWQNAIS